MTLIFDPLRITTESLVPALSESGLALIVSLIAVSLTESRMGRSRGKISLVRWFAPIGTIGFLGVLKVHIASFMTFDIAQELNLPIKNYASASRIGSMRKMHSDGIQWDKGVNCISFGTDDRSHLKITDGFKFEREEQVNYISTAKEEEVISRSAILADKKRRFYSLMVNLIAQSFLCFIFTIGAEVLANRKRPTIAHFFAQVSLQQRL